MLSFLEENEEAIVVISDEAHFHLGNGVVKKQNCRYCAMENPRELYQRPLHSPRVTVWCIVAPFSVGAGIAERFAAPVFTCVTKTTVKSEPR